MSTESSLSSKEHGQLNMRPNHFPGGAVEYKKFVEALLIKYAQNPVALEYIRVYTDPEYQRRVVDYKTALLLRNSTRIAELEEWFHTNYPSLIVLWNDTPQTLIKTYPQSSFFSSVLHRLFKNDTPWAKAHGI